MTWGAVMHNLLVDVIRHTPGSPALGRGGGTNRVYCLDVADRGPGVREEARRWIFEHRRNHVARRGSGARAWRRGRTVGEYGGDLRHLPRWRQLSVFQSVVLPVGR